MSQCKHCGSWINDKPRKIPQKPEAVMWPFTECSGLPVERDFAAGLLWLERQHGGRLKARKLRCHYLAANGRKFEWPKVTA